MFIPTSTYRVQLTADFRLRDLKKIIPYLKKLGISTIYASPISQARKGSTHGYDVVNANQINPEIGTEEEFTELTTLLKENGMTWLQDIVPNHMAYTVENPWIKDLLEKGEASKYYQYFDVNWNHPNVTYKNKIMLPVLGSTQEEVLRKGEIKLVFDEAGFQFAYFDNKYPLRIEDYAHILIHLAKNTEDSLPDTLQDLSREFSAFSKNLSAATDRWPALRQKLFQLYNEQHAVKTFIQQGLKYYNSHRDELKKLIDNQHYLLTYWKVTEQEMNYRRFFTVNELICLRIEQPKVFDAYHQLIKRWLDEQKIQGVRVDHIDGLYDPEGYLKQLRNLTGEDAYIVVEKILEWEETMPEHWPIQGTTGYDFLAMANQLFEYSRSTDKLADLYSTINVTSYDYDDLVYQNKLFILLNRMGGELNNLMHLLKELELVPAMTDDEEKKMYQAMSFLLASFPVYRIYPNQFPFSEVDKEVLAEAFKHAEGKIPHYAMQAFNQLKEIFNGEASDDKKRDKNRLKFVMRFQQFTGPLAAKGVEDTTFYIYNRLISHNEVGDSPEPQDITVSRFHAEMKKRPLHTMNATATHDTKRGEDARMRINVLSEIPQEWKKNVMEWQKINGKHKVKQPSAEMPDINDEYFIYQTLIGTYPLHVKPKEVNFAERLNNYMLKVVREAKVHSSWSSPKEEYETAVTKFVHGMLHDQEFLNSFLPFVRKVARAGGIYSTGQTLLKITAPGVPDIYQGRELWDLSMVDPDNRRPVDYQLRSRKLNEMEQDFGKDPLGLIQKLITNLDHPDIKMFTTFKSLTERRKYSLLFQEGNYIPVRAGGKFSKSVLAFIRQHENQQVLIVIPHKVSLLDIEDSLPLGKTIWEDTYLKMPDMRVSDWGHIFTKQTLKHEEQIKLSDLLADFPVAMLFAENK